MRLRKLLTATVVLGGILSLAGNARAAVWQVPGSFPTLQIAMDSSLVKDGDTLNVLAGRHHGSTVTKAVTIRGVGDAVIFDGPAVSGIGNAGFLFPGGGQGSGATIEALRFDRVAFPVFSRGADYVSVIGNTMKGANQAVTNWGYGSWGHAWDVTDNVILDLRVSCGGGIGILIGDFEGGTVSDNVVANNQITANVRVAAGDCGGYNAPGVVLYADFRYGALGATKIERNRISKNRIRISSRNPGLVTASAVELSDTRGTPTDTDVVNGNAVVYNDLRGSSVFVALTPAELSTVNDIQGNIPAPDQSPQALDLEGAPRYQASPVR
jgi:hypothetical protein